MSAAELQEGAKPITHRVDEQVVVLRDPTRAPDDVPRASHPREQRYIFDAAFDASATQVRPSGLAGHGDVRLGARCGAAGRAPGPLALPQETVYRATTRGLVAGVLSGSNATVFAYGPTGCGKTHTMLGSDGEPGVCARALGDLFQAIEDAGGDTEYEVSMSYLEIYNETLRDLLNPSLGYLELREDARGTVQVAGLTEVSATSAEEVVRLLARGNRRRRQEPTAANGTSSRSHAVLQVTVRQRHRGTALRRGRLLMIDLAGSERAAQTQNRGQRMKEGAHINRSLLALGNCIEALSSTRGSKYINYRDSKLTRLLKDSLGGKSRTVMIAHISPASTAFEESRSTLAYADRAKSIRTKVRHNLLSASCCVAQCGGTMANLRRDILHPDRQQDSEPAPGKRRDIRYIQAQVRLGRLREELLGACREQAALRQRLLQLEGTVLRARLEASRHLLALSRWEQRARRWGKEGQREPDGPGETQRNWDMGDEKSGAPGPPDVAVACESFVALAEEQGRLREQKAELARCFQRSQQHARGLQEPAELRPRSLLGGSHRPRALCARIVQQQRQLIADRRLSVPRALQELYQTHLEELPGGPRPHGHRPPRGHVPAPNPTGIQSREPAGRRAGQREGAGPQAPHGTVATSAPQGGQRPEPRVQDEPTGRVEGERGGADPTAQPRHGGPRAHAAGQHKHPARHLPGQWDRLRGGCGTQGEQGDVEQHQETLSQGHPALVPHPGWGQPGGDSRLPGGHPSQPLPGHPAVGTQEAGDEGRVAGCQKEEGEEVAVLRGHRPQAVSTLCMRPLCSAWFLPTPLCPRSLLRPTARGPPRLPNAAEPLQAHGAGGDTGSWHPGAPQNSAQSQAPAEPAARCWGPVPARPQQHQEGPAPAARLRRGERHRGLRQGCTELPVLSQAAGPEPRQGAESCQHQPLAQPLLGPATPLSPCQTSTEAGPRAPWGHAVVPSRHGRQPAARHCCGPAEEDMRLGFGPAGWH
ncbi:kinesin-like protein KIF19 isoform X3 [Anser cygnoides]|uniref:kinesin-like protein KIF19 isoform X3 n=1 Tax=Anser cygnoides TaxID=8845 RepID=UPI0034D310AC